MFGGDGLLQVGGNQRLDDDAAAGIGGGDHAIGDKLLHPVVGHERTDLIAGQQFELPGAIARGHAHAIAIRVRGDDEVGAFFFRQRHGLGQRLGILGIRRLDRRKAAILHFLGGDRQVAESEAVEHRLDNDAADAMDRGEDDLQPAARRLRDHGAVEDERFEAGHVGVIGFLAENGDFPLLLRGHRFVDIAFHRVDLGDDPAGVRLDDLGSVAEVDLVAVIVRRIVARGDDDPRAGIDQAHAEAELRRGARAGEDKHVHAILRRDARGQFGEILGKVPRVMGDGDARLAGQVVLREPLLQVGHQPLRRPADVVEIHRVCAHARALRAIQRLRLALLGGGHDLANGPPP